MNLTLLCLITAVSVLRCLATIPQATASQAQTKPPAQQSPLQLKTQLVDIRAVVTNKQGGFIDGLKKQDFELLEDGRPQEISFFLAESIPTSSTARLPQTAALGAAGPNVSQANTPARTVVIFVDSLNMSPGSLLRTKQALKKFLDEKLNRTDMVALVATSGSLGLLAQFTRDRLALKYAIDRLGAPGLVQRSLFSPYVGSMVDRGDKDTLDFAIAVLQAEEHITGRRDFLESMAHQRASQVLAESTYQRRMTLLTLKEIVRRLAELPGLRLIAFVSDGFSMQDSLGGVDTSDLNAAVSKAVRSGVLIYSLYAKGLDTSPLFDPAVNLPGTGVSPGVVHSVVSSSESDLKDGLNALAKDTGGETFFNTNDMLGSLVRSLDANTVYYALAYYPQNLENRRYRRITVRVKNHPEYQVRSQKGYVAEEPATEAKVDRALSPQQKLINAMQGVLPVTDIKVEALADYLERDGSDAQVYLRAHVDGGSLLYAEQNHRYHFKLEIVTVAYDLTGKTVASKVDNVEANMKPETYEAAKRVGFLKTLPLSLKPGLYQIRIGVREEETDKTGTATVWVEVPDLGRHRLVMSSLVIGRDPSTRDLGISGNDDSQVPPSNQSHIIKVFQHTERLIYYFRIYNLPADATQAAGPEMRFAFLQGADAAAQTDWQAVSSRQIGKDTKGIVIGGQLGLNYLKPGIYDLQVTIRDPKSKQIVERSVAFGIEAR